MSYQFLRRLRSPQSIKKENISLKKYLPSDHHVKYNHNHSLKSKILEIFSDWITIYNSLSVGVEMSNHDFIFERCGSWEKSEKFKWEGNEDSVVHTNREQFNKLNKSNDGSLALMCKKFDWKCNIESSFCVYLTGNKRIWCMLSKI